MSVRHSLLKSLKGLFIENKLHTVVKPAQSFIINFSSLARFSAWTKAYPAKYTNDFYVKDIQHTKRYNMYEVVAAQEKLAEAPIQYLEFGVAKGDSIRWWTQKNTNPQSTFTGFDLFTGLPEDWLEKKKGYFSTGGEPPKIDDSRCSFQKGLFQDTLTAFLPKVETAKRKIIHLDADLYSSTLFVLTTLAPYLRKGDLLFFDEFTSLQHEFKALEDFTAAYYFKYQLLGAVNNYHQIAIEVL